MGRWLSRSAKRRRARPDPGCARPGAARGGDAAGRTGPDHRAGRQRQDDHDGRPARGPALSRRSARPDLRRDLQPRRGSRPGGTRRAAPRCLCPGRNLDRGPDAPRSRAPGPSRCRRGPTDRRRSTAAAAECPPARAGRRAISGVAGSAAARHVALGLEDRGPTSTRGCPHRARRVCRPPQRPRRGRLRRSRRARL